MPSPDYAPVQQLLWWPDTTSLDIIYAAAGHAASSEDPLWMLMVGPPGCGKTEIIRSLREHPITQSLDTWTPRTFLSGQRNREGPDILRILNGRLLLIKDLTTLADGSKESTREIVGQLRSIYDGYWDRATGNGQLTAICRFGLLAGCTPAIDVLHMANGALGDRFLRVEWPVDRPAIARQAGEIVHRKTDLRIDLARFSVDILQGIIQRWQSYVFLPLGDRAQLLIELLSLTVTEFRSPVQRDYQHRVVDDPVVDAGGRLSSGLTMLCRSLLCLREEQTAGAEVIAALRRVAYSMLPRMRRRILATLLLATSSLEARQIEALTLLPSSTLREQLEDLVICDIVRRGQRGQGYSFRLSDWARELAECSGLFQQ